jgi:PAS domain S-box-containing protein
MLAVAADRGRSPLPGHGQWILVRPALQVTNWTVMQRPALYRSFAPLEILLVTIAACVPLLLLGSSWLFQRQFDESRALRDAASATFETRYTLERLLKLHLDLETAGRGFIISQNSSFLAPYNQAEKQIEAVLLQLSRSLDQKQEEPLFRELDTASRQKRAFAAQVIALTERGSRDEAVRLVASGKGKLIMDRIRVSVAQIDAIRRTQLQSRLDQSEREARHLSRTTMVLHTAVILLLLAAAVIGMRINAARARALARMRESNERQSAIFDSAEDGLMLLDTDARITSHNPAVAQMFGYSSTELVGQRVGVLFREAPRDEDVAAFLRALDPARMRLRQVREFEGVTRTGAHFPVEVALNVVQTETQRSFLAVIRDITKRKQVEQMKSDFVSVVSHELRTPLTSIAGSLGLLAGGAAGELPERARKLVGIAQANSARLVRLINDILDIEKIEAGQMAFDIQPLPLAPLLEQCAQANAGFAEKYGVEIAVESVPGELAVMADEDRLVQVMTNLISNAVKFSPTGETVRVFVVPGSATHRISVAGLGPGISDHFRSRIFQKFAQADASDTRQKGGTGLGLSIVAEIVSRLKGRVSFDSTPGEGATFHVDLPAPPIR